MNIYGSKLKIGLKAKVTEIGTAVVLINLSAMIARDELV
jgi:hypothetical protein